MRREYHVALIGQIKGAYKGLVWKPEGKSHLDDPGAHGTTLKWIFKKLD